MLSGFSPARNLLTAKIRCFSSSFMSTSVAEMFRRMTGGYSIVRELFCKRCPGTFFCLRCAGTQQVSREKGLSYPCVKKYGIVSSRQVSKKNYLHLLQKLSQNSLHNTLVFETGSAEFLISIKLTDRALININPPDGIFPSNHPTIDMNH